MLVQFCFRENLHTSATCGYVYPLLFGGSEFQRLT